MCVPPPASLHDVALTATGTAMYGGCAQPETTLTTCMVQLVSEYDSAAATAPVGRQRSVPSAAVPKEQVSFRIESNQTPEIDSLEPSSAIRYSALRREPSVGSAIAGGTGCIMLDMPPAPPIPAAVPPVPGDPELVPGVPEVAVVPG